MKPEIITSSQLTVEQRLEVYKAALESLHLKTKDFWLCILVKQVAGNLDILPYWQSKQISADYPELFAQKPPHTHYETSRWWEEYDKQSRINALRAAIKLTEEGVYP